MTGFIALHRDIMEWEWWDDHNTTRLFITCLLAANHKERNWQGMKIERGQFVSSFDSLSKKTGLSIQSVRTSIEKLKKSQNLTIKTTNKFSVLTVVNYDKYQSSDKQPTNNTTNEQQTTNKQSITNNNDNNVNKYKGDFEPSETQSNPKEPSGKNSPSGVGLPDSELWFAGDVIRLTTEDFFAWCKMTGYDKQELHDILYDRDEWYIGQPKSIQKNWFLSTSNFLRKQAG